MKTLIQNESILEVRWHFQGAHNLFLRGRNIFSEKNFLRKKSERLILFFQSGEGTGDYQEGGKVGENVWDQSVHIS